MKKYIEKYNFVRPTSIPRFHYSLGYRTPAEVAYKYATVYGNVERVIRTIEEELWFIEGIDYTIDHLRAMVSHFTS